MNTEIIAIILSCISIVAALYLVFRLLRLQQTVTTITTGVKDKNLEELIAHYSKVLEKTDTDFQRVIQDFINLREENRRYYRKTGLVRFSAFKDTGSDQSFALAMLDENNNGFVISSLYGRDISRSYAKQILAGKSENYRLTEEEEQALSQAIKQ